MVFEEPAVPVNTVRRKCLLGSLWKPIPHTGDRTVPKASPARGEVRGRDVRQQSDQLPREDGWLWGLGPHIGEGNGFEAGGRIDEPQHCQVAAGIGRVDVRIRTDDPTAFPGRKT